MGTHETQSSQLNFNRHRSVLITSLLSFSLLFISFPFIMKTALLALAHSSKVVHLYHHHQSQALSFYLHHSDFFSLLHYVARDMYHFFEVMKW